MSEGGAGLASRATRALRDWGDYDELIIAAVYAIGAAVLALSGAPLLVRLPFGLLAVLFLPGYAAVALAFPRREGLDTVERLALSLGLSLALVAVLAVALDRSPWGVTAVALVSGLSLCTLIFTALAGWRRTQIPPHERFFLVGSLGWGGFDLPTRRALLVLAGALLISAAALTITLTAKQPPLTQFYALGPEGLAEDYPRAARVGEAVTVTVGIANRQGRTMTYQVRVADAADLAAVIGETGPIVIADGARWEGPLSFTPRVSGGDRALLIRLHEGDSLEAHRELRLWLDVSP